MNKMLFHKRERNFTLLFST